MKRNNLPTMKYGRGVLFQANSHDVFAAEFPLLAQKFLHAVVVLRGIE